VRALADLPIAGIDLNLGCPAPKVYKKNVGGGLLREPARVDAILRVLREVSPGLMTVKMRIGFDSAAHFEELLETVERNRADLLSLHARTVKGMYRSPVAYERIAQAARRLPCPVLGNGEVTSAGRALWVMRETGCRGVMIGRGAIRNPWIFRQLREHLAGRTPFAPTLADVHGYVERLHTACGAGQDLPPKLLAGRMKKFLNFVGQNVDPDGAFLQAMRRAPDPDALLNVCEAHLLAGGRADMLFAPEPYPGLVARPNAEAPQNEPAACAL
jgi:tRNA-dihydrouridine synthase